MLYFWIYHDSFNQCHVSATDFIANPTKIGFKYWCCWDKCSIIKVNDLLLSWENITLYHVSDIVQRFLFICCVRLSRKMLPWWFENSLREAKNNFIFLLFCISALVWSLVCSFLDWLQRHFFYIKLVLSLKKTLHSKSGLCIDYTLQ